MLTKIGHFDLVFDDRLAVLNNVAGLLDLLLKWIYLTESGNQKF